MECENCGKEHNGNYGSGRFCSNKCARSFSTKNKRKEINEKVSKSLKGRKGWVPKEKRNFHVFTQEERKKGTEKASNKRIEDALKRWIEEGVFTRSIKPFLLKEQSETCSICGIKNKWNGKELVFVLDHIDGNSENNNKNNLRLICPNCDSQLDTYKSKNKGNGRYLRRKRYKEGKSY